MKIVDEKLLAEFRSKGQCELCLRKCYPLDPHHLWTRGAGRLDIRCNLISLCRVCHSEVEHKQAKERILEIVCRRERAKPEAIWEVVCFVRRWPKHKRDQISRGAKELEADSLALFSRMWESVDNIGLDN